MPAWDSKSSGDSGNFNPPEPNISDASHDPSGNTSKISDYSGFGPNREVPSANVGSGGNSGFAVPDLSSGGGQFEGGNSDKRTNGI